MIRKRNLYILSSDHSSNKIMKLFSLIKHKIQVSNSCITINFEVERSRKKLIYAKQNKIRHEKLARKGHSHPKPKKRKWISYNKDFKTDLVIYIYILFTTENKILICESQIKGNGYTQWLLPLVLQRCKLLCLSVCFHVHWTLW